MKNNIIKNYIIKKSNIHGNGIFTTKFIKKWSKIDVGIKYYFFFIPLITKFGSMINHSYKPNCELLRDKSKYWIISSEDLEFDIELTLNYNKCPWFIDRAKTHCK